MSNKKKMKLKVFDENTIIYRIGEDFIDCSEGFFNLGPGRERMLEEAKYLWALQQEKNQKKEQQKEQVKENAKKKSSK